MILNFHDVWNVQLFLQQLSGLIVQMNSGKMFYYTIFQKEFRRTALDSLNSYVLS